MIRPYWHLSEDLFCLDGKCLYSQRIIVLKSLCKEILDNLHAAHQETAGMKARASMSVYWPGISSAITSRHAQCDTCNRISPSQPAQLFQPSPAPCYPFQMVAADYFHVKRNTYLAYADRYTGWLIIVRCPAHGSDARHLISELRTLFSTYGAPEEIATDGGQPFSAYSVQQFILEWCVEWRLSSAYYTQSNGRAEVAVKTAKRLLLNKTSRNGDLHTDKFVRALMQYRNTPLAYIGKFPTQLLYGRTLCDHTLCLPGALKIRQEWIALAEDREIALAKRHRAAADRYNEHTRQLRPLTVGTTVAVQNQCGTHPTRWDKPGRIV